jgi:hypothetical protein
MNQYVKELLWSAWVWIVMFNAVGAYRAGELSGNWTIAVCWICLGYFVKSMMLADVDAALSRT